MEPSPIIKGYWTYDGFQTFSWLADFAGIPVDQINFIVTQFTALALAGFLRKTLNPIAVTTTVRHAFSLIMGLFLVYFCFGKQLLHVIGLPALCYIALCMQDPKNVQRGVFAISLCYLACVHCHRQIYDYGSYTLDVTGPLMVITQKVTSLALAVHDGMSRKEEELSPKQRYYAVPRKPTALEFFSYVFHFQTMMAGPIIYYRDYIDFVTGRFQQQRMCLKGLQDENKEVHTYELSLKPSPKKIVAKKLMESLVCAFIFVALQPMYPIERVKEEEFLNNTSMVYKYWYLSISTMLVRFKYYHAWIFADAICNNSGMGYNGVDERGQHRWDLVTNVDVFKFETALSLRDSIESWNKGTNLWLRMMVYDRIKKHRILYTYLLSAFWHGFYPGYYLTFANGALFTNASRCVRRHIRPYFLTSKTKKVFYDAITMLTTRIVLAYVTFSFILLECKPSLVLYLKMYLAPHLFGLSAILVLPMFPRAREAGGHKPMLARHDKHTSTELKAHGAEGHGSSAASSNGHAHKDK